MNFFKQILPKSELITKKKVTDIQTLNVTNFYKESPFPNYKLDDNKGTILEKGNKNYLTSKFKNFIGYNKNVLEVGCGTGQLSFYFAIGTNNNVLGLDPTIESLIIASNFAKKNNIGNIEFINSDIFDDVLKEEVFDFIWCNGVLHHTKNPYLAFEILIKSLKKNGYVLIGLYNKIGRIRTIFRKYLYKIFGEVILNLLDPTLRNLKQQSDERRAWIRDQYMHPIESLHSLDEVLQWFDKNNIQFISSIPSCNLDEDDNLFNKKSRGIFFSRIVNQILMIFNSLGSDGGLFIVIGKKN
jgi:2-polyprenyl-3-methyl-5-hydroxy-6-metoxy-1,4-benzoquinol methylase